MMCEDIRRRLVDYQWGELNEEETKEVREHLSGCRQCSQYEKELRGFLNLISGVEEKEPSDRPWLFLKSRLAGLGPEPGLPWAGRVLGAVCRPVPLYRAVLVSVALISLAWFAGSLHPRKAEQPRTAFRPPTELRTRWSPQPPDTHISFVSTQIVWTGVQSMELIPGRPESF